MNRHERYSDLQQQRDELAHKIELARSTPGITFQDLRVIQRQLEQIEHQMLWINMAPRGLLG